MAIYEVAITGHYFGQLIMNRWNYVSTGAAAGISGSAALASAFGITIDQDPLVETTIIGMWASIVNVNYTFSSAFVRDLYSDTDFVDVPFATPLTGNVVGEGLSPVMAFGFNSNRVRLDVRAGQKRLVGVPETASSTGGVIVAEFRGYMQELAALMSETLSYPAGVPTIDFAPAILGLNKVAIPDTDPVEYKYERYETEAAQLARTAVNVTWADKAEVRSQTSRQYGRGA